MINLLPLQEKKNLRMEENWRLVLILGFLFLIFLISLFLILFSVKSYLWGQVESRKILVDLEEKYFQSSEIQALREKITLANQNLSKLTPFYQKQKRGTEILEKISQTLPPGVYLTTLSWQKDTSQISLSGFSPTREILFEFKKKLEEKEFREIYFPPQNWIEPTDIDFYVTFKVK